MIWRIIIRQPNTRSANLWLCCGVDCTEWAKCQIAADKLSRSASLYLSLSLSFSFLLTDASTYCEKRKKIIIELWQKPAISLLMFYIFSSATIFIVFHCCLWHISTSQIFLCIQKKKKTICIFVNHYHSITLACTRTKTKNSYIFDKTSDSSNLFASNHTFRLFLRTTPKKSPITLQNHTKSELKASK